MALSESEWEALRAEWRTSPISGRALARKYGVNEASIRERRNKSPKDWVRDPGIAQAVQDEGQRRTLEGAVREAILSTTHAATQVRGRARGAAGGLGVPGDQEVAAGAAVDAVQELLDQARATIEDVAADAQADLLARTNLDHLGRTARLKTLFDRHATLLGHALRFPELRAGDDGKQQAELDAEQAAALAVLVGQTRDTIASHLQAAVAMAEKIQVQERRALGMDQGPKKVELSGPGGGPIVSNTATEVAFDPAKLTTAQLAALYEAGAILTGAQERPGIPLPPGDPDGEDPTPP